MGSIPAHHGWRSGMYPFILSTLQRFGRSGNVKFFRVFPKMFESRCTFATENETKKFSEFFEKLVQTDGQTTDGKLLYI